MNLTGLIIDSSTSKGIPFASVEILTAQNAETGQGTIAGATGEFSLNSPLLDDQSSLIKISSVGYGPSVVPVTTFINQGGAALDPAPQNLPAVTVTANAPNKNVNAGILVAAGVGVLLLSSATSKKKVGKVDTGTLLIAGTVAVAGLLIYKLFSKPAAPAPVPVIQTISQPSAGNTTASIVSAAGQALPSIINAIANL